MVVAVALFVLTLVETALAN